MYNRFFSQLYELIRKLNISGMHEIIEFKHQTLIGKPCYISRSFEPAMKRFCKYLELYGLKFHVTNSHRLINAVLYDAIVEPSKLSNHFIGHALDGNIVLDGLYYNSEKFERLIEEGLVDERVLAFLDKIAKDKTLRWGGIFQIKDVVHFDDETNRRDIKLYKTILKIVNPKPNKKTS